MEQLTTYMTWLNGADMPTKDYLKAIINRYPWFTTAQMLLEEAEKVAIKPNEIIDTFLSKGTMRVVANDDTPDYIDNVSSDEFGCDDELITQELAEIYLAQGHKKQALEIYRKLCLVNPEKSAYFVKIIEHVEKS